MLTGSMVVLDSGDLATAMRASMAIPGAFAPVEIDQYVLSDGGMVRNIPVDVARNLCADVVIVVNLVEEELKRENLQTATQLILRSSDVGIMANENLQLASLTDRDIRIDVLMGDITTADFERVPDTIPLGEKAARGVADQLAKLAVPAEQYQAWRDGVTTGQNLEVRLAAVEYKGLQRVNPEYLESRAQVHADQVVDTAAISNEAQRMSALQEFESVSYELTGDPDHPTLRMVAAREDLWTGLPQVRPRPVRLGGWRPRVRGLRQAHAHLGQLSRCGMAQRGATRLLQPPLHRVLPAARRRAAVLRRTAPGLRSIVGRRLRRRGAARPLPFC